MKRVMLVALVVGLFLTTCGTIFAQDASDFLMGQRHAYLGSGNKDLDPLYIWGNWIQGQVLAGGKIGTGKVFYVDSGVTNEGDGTTWAKAKDTIDEAINLCTASNGDVILVAQGHAESYSAADGFDADVAGITIIFCGNGANQGTLTFADTDATVAIGAANVTIVGGRFLAGISEVVIGISIEAGGDDFTLLGAQFPEPLTSTFEFDKAIVLASGADRVTIQGCIAYSADATGATDWIDMATGVNNGTRIIGNTVHGEFGNAIVYSDKADLETYVRYNDFTQLTASQFVIEFTSTATGIIANNRCNSATVDYEVDPGSCAYFDNDEGTITPEGTSLYDLVGTLKDAAAGTGVYPTGITDDSMWAMLLSKSATASASSYNNTTDSQEALSDQVAKLDGVTISTAPVAASLASFIASGGTSLGTQLATSKSLVDAIGTNGTTVADTATGVAGMIGVNDADNAMDTSTVVANANGSVFERDEALQVATLPSKSHPNYFTVDANMASATWNVTANSHEIVTVTGACRVTIMVEVVTSVVTVGTNGTIALGFAGNTSAVFSATALDAADTGDVFSAVYGSAATTPIGAEASGSLTHALLEMVSVGGVDIGYTLATNNGESGILRFHVWWTPLDSTGLCAAGAGGTL